MSSQALIRKQETGDLDSKGLAETTDGVYLWILPILSVDKSGSNIAEEEKRRRKKRRK